ncbi:hypothetical protein JAO78_010930 [Alishewanella sp. 16-MA]|uniref:Uncharacterized protein n=1 Tax=Alishewanella maricola TaxID=2795740 RepID=A0ABS8C4R9_9ALTE|nr:hypothetical protein [Alishewanella maricola]MCB5227327.1 hypothetical protein [Alishewanella maricola]
MKKNLLAILTALAITASYFLLTAVSPEMTLGMKATLLAVLATVFYVLFAALLKKD